MPPACCCCANPATAGLPGAFGGVIPNGICEMDVPPACALPVYTLLCFKYSCYSFVEKLQKAGDKHASRRWRLRWKVRTRARPPGARAAAGCPRAARRPCRSRLPRPRAAPPRARALRCPIACAPAPRAGAPVRASLATATGAVNVGLSPRPVGASASHSRSRVRCPTATVAAGTTTAGTMTKKQNARRRSRRRKGRATRWGTVHGLATSTRFYYSHIGSYLILFSFRTN